MKLLFKSKDGGKESNVTGYWLLESKRFFSIVLLRFDKGSREAYHNHAFNAISWFIKGRLAEYTLNNNKVMDTYWYPSIIPIITTKDRMHKVYGMANKSWVISFRGPWENTWKEYLPLINKFVTLTHGRKIHENSLN